MSPFSYPVSFSEGDDITYSGNLELDQPLPLNSKPMGSGFSTSNRYYRTGRIALEGYPNLDLVLYHSPATAAFMYLRATPVDLQLLETIGITPGQVAMPHSLWLPGQLCLGAERSRLIGRASTDMFSAPPLRDVISQHRQQNLAIFPIAREGLKYQVTEAIQENFGYFCDEIVLDAHHVFDNSVPVYNRKVEMTIFKDKDLDKKQHANIKVAYIADSIASGLVMKEVVARVKERFDNITHVEIIAPLATIRGLCRIAQSDFMQDLKVRVHVFETLLNALPPDYYYSAHFNIPEFHIRPDLEAAYREWWGQDAANNYIADTACAGYGWSEVFYSPRKQIQMMNGQLEARHHLTITDIIKRNLTEKQTLPLV